LGQNQGRATGVGVVRSDTKAKPQASVVARAGARARAQVRGADGPGRASY